MEARPYQKTAVDNSVQQFHAGKKSTLAVLATGLGKTAVSGFLAREMIKITDERVLFLANRKNLVNQAYKTFTEHFNLFGDIEMGTSKVKNPAMCQFVSASIQSISNKRRLENYNPKDFGLVIVDEAHHDAASNPSYRKVREHFQDVFTLGLTATPIRDDGQPLADSYEDVCVRMDAADAIRDGWLTPVVPLKVDCSSIRIDLLEKKRRDFLESELAELFNERALNEVVVGIKERHEGKQFIVFMPGVNSARNLTFNLLTEGFNVACITGDTEDGIRNQIFADYASGKLQGIIGCMVLTEGFDAPNIHKIFNCRATKSLTLLTQILGRELRTLPGVITPEMYDSVDRRIEAIAKSAKPYCEFLDVSGSAGVHKIITPLDVLGTKSEQRPEIIELAKEKVKTNSTHRIDELIDIAERELDAKAAKEMEERRAKAAAVVKITGSVETRQFDLFGGQKEKKVKKELPSQIPYQDKITLKRHGHDWRKLDRQDAADLVAKYRAMYDGKPTPNQMRTLERYGETAENIHQAGAIISMIAAGGWRGRKKKLLEQNLKIKLVKGLYYVYFEDGEQSVQLTNRGGSVARCQKKIQEIKEN